MIKSIVITAIEVGALITLFALIYGGVNVVFKAVSSSVLKNQEPKIARYHRQIAVLFLLSCAILCLCIIGINGYIIYQGNDVLEIQKIFLPAIPMVSYKSSEMVRLVQSSTTPSSISMPKLIFL
jgi:moderate conductance mechanosensitive channel